MNENIKIKSKHPYLKANPISRLFYCWLNDFIKKGKRQKLAESDLYTVLKEDSSQHLCDNLERQWNKQLKSPKPSLLRAIFWTYGPYMFAWCLVFLIEEIIKIAQPILIGRLIRCFTMNTYNNNNINDNFNNVDNFTAVGNATFNRLNSTSATSINTNFETYMYALGVSLCTIAPTMIHHPVFLAMFSTGMRLRLACCGMVYKKSLKLSTSSLGKTTIGQMVNLMSNDVQRFDMTAGIICYIVFGPLEVIAVGIILWFYIDWGGVAGMVTLVLVIPVTGCFAKLFARLRLQISKLTDQRLSQMNELLHGIRLIKMSCWEDFFERTIMSTRCLEFKQLVRAGYARATTISSIFYSGKLVLFATILTYILLGNDVTAEMVFVTMSLYHPVRFTMTMGFPIAMHFGAESMIAVRRLQEFLLLPEKSTSTEENNSSPDGSFIKKKKSLLNGPKVENRNGEADGDVKHGGGGGAKHGDVISKNDDDVFVNVKNVSLTWDKSKVTILRNMSFSVQGNDLLMVVGSVGSGKTSLLMMILKELPILTGHLDIRGKLAYASQQTWIFSSSIRQNILLGYPFDQNYYETVLKCCGLKEDLADMPHGDLTHIGDRGATLSGGQRARVNLARAVYSGADVFLFDDPLSAVDANVSQHIFNECINGLLSNKLRILVTHQIQYLTMATKILLVDKDQNHMCGSYDELVSLGVDFHKVLTTESDQSDEKDSISVSALEIQTLSKFKDPLLSSLNSVLYIDAVDGDVRFNVDSQSLGSIPSVAGSVGGLPGMRSKRGSRKDSKLLTQEVLPMIKSEKLNSKSQQHLQQTEKGIQDEEMYTGETIPASLYLEYTRAGTGNCGVFILCVLNVLAQFFFLITDWWLVHWCNKVERFYSTPHQFYTTTTSTTTTTTNDHIHKNINIYQQNYNTTTTITATFKTGPQKFPEHHFHLLIYGILTLLVAIVGLIRAWFSFHMFLYSSHNVHKDMLHSIIRSPVTFFDANPTGRILNRFSKDLGQVDESFPLVFYDIVQNLCLLLGIFIVITVLNPWVFIAIIVMFFIFGLLRRYFITAFRNVKRLESILKGPVFSHINATFLGITTIRSHKVEALFNREFHDLQDDHSAAFSLYLYLGRWLAVRLEWLCTGLICVVTFAAVFAAQTMNGATVGLSLSYVITLLWLFQWVVRQSTELESLMTCVERMIQYSKLPVESTSASATEPTTLPSTTPKLIAKSSSSPKSELEHLRGDAHDNLINSQWPQRGEVRFKDVSLRYKTDAPYILKRLNFEIKPGEKVGVVGRTGAGKSSLMNVMFRLYRYEGLVLVDNLDIQDLDLFQVRQKISIIPQESILLQGTLRKNLDPLNQHKEHEMWNVLERIKLIDMVKSSGRGLEFWINESGNNLSAGQQQLLCLARALLEQNKILIIDEATANVDRDTDTFIQKVLRQEFVDCTVLCIAHRLNTIIDYDRIMLLDEGEIKEFDSPGILLRNKNSLFTKLAQQTGKEEYQRLLQSVQISENNKKSK